MDPSTGHSVGSRDQQAGTFMHELGLQHGSGDGINCKTNYFSIMKLCVPILKLRFQQAS